MEPTAGTDLTMRRLRAWRTRQGLSQMQLARAAGVDASVIAKSEQGRRHPHPATCRKIADGLGIAPSQIEEFHLARSGAVREPVPQRQWLR